MKAVLNRHQKNQDGFTLLEIIAVLVVMGILSAIVINRWTSFDAEVYAGADALKSHLRYAQAQAMNKDPNIGENTLMGISYDQSSNQYWLFSQTTSDIRILPDDAKYTTVNRTIDLNAKRIKLDGSFTIYFDNHGIPYTSYTSATSNTPLSAARIIVVSGISGSPTINVTVTPQTGFVP